VVNSDVKALEGKETIEVLQEIEININELMKMINIIALDEDGPNGKNERFTDKMKKAEQDRKAHKQEEQKKERERIDTLNYAKAQQAMESRMNKVFKKTGKGLGMYRSEQPKVKTITVKKDKDPDTMDQEYYLGMDLKNLEQVIEAHKNVPAPAK